MANIWPPPPTNQPRYLPPQVPERYGVVALLLTVWGMLLVLATTLSHMHLITVANRNPKADILFNGLGLLGVLLLVIGGVLGGRSWYTRYGPNAVIMSFFMLLAVCLVALVLLVQGQL